MPSPSVRWSGSSRVSLPSAGPNPACARRDRYATVPPLADGACGCWGVLASAQGFIGSAAQLGGLRFVLGVAEAGYYPGAVYYLSTLIRP